MRLAKRRCERENKQAGGDYAGIDTNKGGLMYWSMYGDV